MSRSVDPDAHRSSATRLSRRHFVGSGAATLTAALLPTGAAAKVPVPYDWNASPPTDKRADFIEWMVANRGEDPSFLGQRWDRLKQLIASRDLWDARCIRALPHDAARGVSSPARTSAAPTNGTTSTSASA